MSKTAQRRRSKQQAKGPRVKTLTITQPDWVGVFVDLAAQPGLAPDRLTHYITGTTASVIAHLCGPTEHSNWVAAIAAGKTFPVMTELGEVLPNTLGLKRGSRLITQVIAQMPVADCDRLMAEYLAITAALPRDADELTPGQMGPGTVFFWDKGMTVVPQQNNQAVVSDCWAWRSPTGLGWIHWARAVFEGSRGGHCVLRFVPDTLVDTETLRDLGQAADEQVPAGTTIQ